MANLIFSGVLKAHEEKRLESLHILDETIA
jgi:hypothetical protein